MLESSKPIEDHKSDQETQLDSTTSKKKRILFTVDEDPNSQVFLAGSFNNWSHEAMSYDTAKHQFVKVKMLCPGHYEYKFLVNGTWIIDEKNEDFIYNDQGSMNSMLIVG